MNREEYIERHITENYLREQARRRQLYGRTLDCVTSLVTYPLLGEEANGIVLHTGKDSDEVANAVRKSTTVNYSNEEIKTQKLEGIERLRQVSRSTILGHFPMKREEYLLLMVLLNV